MKPRPMVTFKGVLLSEGTDYTLSYSNNKKLNDLNGNDKPTVKVKGKGYFTGTDATTFFKIVQADMTAEGISVDANDVLYKDKSGNWKTKVSVVDKDGKKLSYTLLLRLRKVPHTQALLPEHTGSSGMISENWGHRSDRRPTPEKRSSCQKPTSPGYRTESR